MRLCLISLDAVSGADTSFLMQLPNLSRLRARGVFCNRVQTIYPTITYPIHNSLVTGCYPDAHGIGHNRAFEFNKDSANQRWHCNAREVRVRTLHEAAKAKGLDVASILWPTTAQSKAIRRNFPEGHPLPKESMIARMLLDGSPLWILRMYRKYGKLLKGAQEPELDAFVTAVCEDLYASHRPPDVLTVHLLDADINRHRFGASSEEARKAMIRLDCCVGRIYQALEKRHLLKDTLFCVVSDHGQQDVYETVPLDAQLQEACGARAQTLGMGAYIYAEDEAAAREALDVFREEWHIGHIYEEEELQRLHAPKDVHLAVDAAPDVAFVDEDEEEPLGDHGFPVTDSAAQALFFLSGPGICRGKQLEKLDLVDIAPTLAMLLGLSLPEAQGKTRTDVMVSDERIR